MKIKELTLDRDSLAAAIASDDSTFDRELHDLAYRTKIETIGPEVYLRGLIEISNICVKNCLYCGIRRDIRCSRYELSEEEVLVAARIAAGRRFGSIVIQGGERTDTAFIRKITSLIKAIKKIVPAVDGDPTLGITLSLGEQKREVYEEWFDAGAHRYLLRIESSNPDLFHKIHPNDPLHSYDRRLRALYDLKETGFQAGTGAMIGLPFQTAEDMADDLLFYKKFDAPMIGMGPYNPHPETPLTLQGAPYPSAERRFALGLKMIALLRLLMPDINIAAATALEVLDPRGREKGILWGANVFMPNITPVEQMIKYNLYDRKTLLRDCPSSVDPEKRDSHICKNCVFPFCALGNDLAGKKIVIGFGHWGDSKHFVK